MQKYASFFFIAILCLGIFLRFYKLDWGEGLYTHPDEYHIVASVLGLSFPNQMHPHFFAYGTGVIYPIYFIKQLLDRFSPSTDIFIVGRFFSAFFSTFTILVVYQICRIFLSQNWSLLAAFLTSFTPGLIQQAHFATPESELTFFLLVTLLFLLRFLQEGKMRFIVITSIFLGLSLGVKIVALLFVPLVAIAILIKYATREKRLIQGLSLSIAVTFLAFFISAPYVFLDYQSFRGTMDYEGSVAMGTPPVFYTRQFIKTTPILFQLQRIFPYTLGPVMEVLGILGVLFLTAGLIRKFNVKNLFFILAFLLLFIPNALLFAKWTRFIATTFALFPVFAVYFLYILSKKRQHLSYSLVGILVITTVFWSLAFFSIYTRHDVRVEASQWLESQTKGGSSFLVEGGNTVDLPLSGNFKRVSLDFYNLEMDLSVRNKIIDALLTSDYFLVQSRRVFINHQRLSKLYPKTAGFYTALFAGELGFVQVKEFQSYPQLGVGSWKLEFADEAAEETWSVFDHPVIRVFKKTKQLSKEEYAKVFTRS